MAEIVFDPAHVMNCAQEVSNHQRNIVNLVQQANSAVNGLGDYQGNAADQFRITFNAMSQKLNDANNVINSYVQFMNKAVEEWEAANGKVEQDVVSFENGQ